MKWLRDGARWLIAVAVVAVFAAPHTSQAQVDPRQVALAYVWQNTVTLADVDGEPLAQPGPEFGYGEGARLFWTADARTLYVARDDGLYATGPGGAAPVQVPGRYGRTIAISQDQETMYYLETAAPQAVEDMPGVESFPLREASMRMLTGGQGRLAGYFGRFQPGASRADLSFAGALYVRDGGLLGPGRPNLWTSFGALVLGTLATGDLNVTSDGTLDLGSGIVADSDPAAEWEECLLKGRFLTGLPPPFGLIETLRCTPGGDMQTQALVQVFLNIAVFGMDVQEAIDAPRFRSLPTCPGRSHRNRRSRRRRSLPASTAHGSVQDPAPPRARPAAAVSRAGLVCAVRSSLRLALRAPSADGNGRRPPSTPRPPRRNGSWRSTRM